MVAMALDTNYVLNEVRRMDHELSLLIPMTTGAVASRLDTMRSRLSSLEFDLTLTSQKPDDLGQTQAQRDVPVTLDAVLAEVDATCSTKEMERTHRTIAKLRGLGMSDSQIARMIADSLKENGKEIGGWWLEVYLSGGRYYARWRFMKERGKRGSRQIGPVRQYDMDVISGAGSPGAVA